MDAVADALLLVAGIATGAFVILAAALAWACVRCGARKTPKPPRLDEEYRKHAGDDELG